MPIAIVTALGRSKKQALPIPPLLGTALLKRFLEDPAVDNLAINSVAPRLLGTSVCKTSLDFSSMRGDPGWPFCMPGSRARSLSSDSL